jgi:hypothetical protein
MAYPATDSDRKLRRHCEDRLLGLRVNRYSWWVHWRELANYMLPRRYKWLITPNMQNRGAPIQNYILDSTATLAARNLASGIMSGVSSPSRPWIKLKINKIDSTQTSPISLWLAEAERLMNLVFQESNFYNAIAVVYFDLVIFGTAVMLVYEDFDDVIHCYNPCLGEYYIDNDGKMNPTVFYREFTMTVAQVVDEFDYENCPKNVQQMYDTGGAALTREVIIAHALEENTEPDKYGIPSKFPWREVYWVWGMSSTTQNSGPGINENFLRKRGYYEKPHIIVRWDLVSNDAYGRSPGMDALPDVKQLQQEVRRKAQAIDKHVNPPMVADVQLKNQPASLLPGGVTYVTGMSTGAKVGFAPAYTINPDIRGMMEDLNEIRERVKETFFNNLFQTISQYETRSNVSATEIDARRAESLVMLGPVLDRIEYELLKPIIDRVFAVMSRARILPPAPPEVQGHPINVEFISMLATSQAAAATSGIERLFQIAGSLVAVDPAVMDNIDIDYALDKYSSLMNNDPKMIRAPAQLAAIRQQRAQQQQADQMAQRAQQIAMAGKNLSETDVGGGQNALQRMTGVAP